MLPTKNYCFYTTIFMIIAATAIQRCSAVRDLYRDATNNGFGKTLEFADKRSSNARFAKIDLGDDFKWFGESRKTAFVS